MESKLEEKGVGAGHCAAGSDSGWGGTGRWSISYLPPPGGGRPSRAELQREPGVVLRESRTLTPTEVFVVTRGGFEGAAAQSRLC